MKNITYKIKKVSDTNTVTCDIEMTVIGNYSVVIYDKFYDFWVDQYAPTYEEAKEVAEELLKNINI
jgi:phosphoribosylformylglycinamidine (FGAM) synthase PurS component